MRAHDVIYYESASIALSVFLNQLYMYIKQSKNSFIRTTEHYGYITNQLTRHDRCYNEFGADLLREISREPQEIEDIIDRLLLLYEGVSFDTLKNDFMEFAESLARDHFVLLADNLEDLDSQDLTFSYSMDNPKTLATNFLQETEKAVSENTQDFFLEEKQGRPLIASLQFELSSRCNERCIHCYIPNDKKNHGFDMPLSKVKSILDEFAEMGGFMLPFLEEKLFFIKILWKLSNTAAKKI